MKWLIPFWLVLLAVLTVHRVGVWKSALSLWSDAVQTSPCSARAHVNLALAETDHEKALVQWQYAALLSVHEKPGCR